MLCDLRVEDVTRQYTASAETTAEVRGSIRFQKEDGATVDRRVVWGPKKTQTNQASTTTI